jgi:hypothetical protein
MPQRRTQPSDTDFSNDERLDLNSGTTTNRTVECDLGHPPVDYRVEAGVRSVGRASGPGTWSDEP